MKIDWKHLATTPGYKSLKAAYVCDVQANENAKRPLRKKAELLSKFKWTIGRAKHYAHNTGEPIDSILNRWEDKRSYWWLNYYQDCKQPKFHSCGVERRSTKKKHQPKQKPRWPMHKKRAMAPRRKRL